MFLQDYLNNLEGFRKILNIVKNAKCLYPSARGRKKHAGSLAKPDGV